MLYTLHLSPQFKRRVCRWLPVLAPISGLEFLRQLQIPQDFLIITELSEGNKLLPRGFGGRLATKNQAWPQMSIQNIPFWNYTKKEVIRWLKTACRDWGLASDNWMGSTSCPQR